MSTPQKLTVNDRTYRFPDKPVVVICLDGSEPAYIEQAVRDGRAPNLARLLSTGTNRIAQCVIPSFTNPNNLSILTGRPPKVHGIAGNYFYDRTTGEEIMMNDARFLRAPTIFQAFFDAGAKVAVVTAKDKLRTLLGKGLDFTSGRAIGFSAEKADQATHEKNGIDDVLNYVGKPLPDVYSAELSEFVFAAGVKLLEDFRPNLMYLSTTDYVQHKAAPGSAKANDFYEMFDRYVGALDAAGCVLAITADHGMNDKHRADKSPDVLYLQDIFDEWLGRGCARVILPITDPYVAHHGALGSFATIYLPDGIGAADAASLLERLRKIEGIEVALAKTEACERFELPADRVGDIVVVGTRSKVFGTSASRHDLSGLTEPLRSHGGISEQNVPLLVNRRTDWPADRVLRNFDIFDVAINHAL
ncbi:MAG: phosphonoacetate hydrolase [Bordetella sp.]|uniref:phosphonoacetate hydrolase n=1 Tax=Bordetella sp. TaxID=28081 RepID=UPI003F7C0960